MDLETEIQTAIDEINLDYGNHDDLYDMAATLTRRAMTAEARVSALEKVLQAARYLANVARKVNDNSLLGAAVDNFDAVMLEFGLPLAALLNATQQEGEVQG